MDGENKGKPLLYEQMDDLGGFSPIFGSTPIWPKDGKLRLPTFPMFGQQSAERFEKDRLMEEPTPGPGAYEVLPSDGKGVIMDTAERWYLGLLQRDVLGKFFCGVVLGWCQIEKAKIDDKVCWSWTHGIDERLIRNKTYWGEVDGFEWRLHHCWSTITYWHVLDACMTSACV